jgi:hypothetical protein
VPPRGLNERSIPYGGHLIRAVQHLRTRQAIARQVAELALEEEQPLPTARTSLPGDPMKLRGIPAVGGRGSVGGAIRGTLPHVDGLVDRSAMHALAVLVRDDANGVSPGSDPLQALLDAEEETLGRLGDKVALGVDDDRRGNGYHAGNGAKRTE